MWVVRALIVVGVLLVFVLPAGANTSPQTLPFSQEWTNTGQITANDNWTGVAGIEGYLGQDLTTSTGTDPQTLLGTSSVANDLDVIANQTNPAITNGGVAEFELTDPVVALQGSAAADAPYLALELVDPSARYAAPFFVRRRSFRATAKTPSTTRSGTSSAIEDMGGV